MTAVPMNMSQLGEGPGRSVAEQAALERHQVQEVSSEGGSEYEGEGSSEVSGEGSNDRNSADAAQHAAAEQVPAPTVAPVVIHAPLMPPVVSAPSAAEMLQLLSDPGALRERIEEEEHHQQATLNGFLGPTERRIRNIDTLVKELTELARKVRTERPLLSQKKRFIIKFRIYLHFFVFSSFSK